MSLLALCTGGALFALGLAAFNILAWPRGRAGGPVARLGRVSVLIPARDEERGIEACVRAACATAAGEVVVCDDGSTDQTAAILERLRPLMPKLRVVSTTGPLPAGWVGKPRACAVLAGAAGGDSLFFVDADVVVAADIVGRLADVVDSRGADVVTAVPRQEMRSFVEQLVLPLLHVSYLAWLPLPLIWRSQDPRFLAANGQLLWMSRDALVRAGGFEAVRADIVDDMALCRCAKRAGLRVVFADGFAWARCRMYRSAAEVVAGFGKNLHEGVGGVAGVVGVVGLYAGVFVVPWLFVSTLVGAVGAGAGLALRLMLAARFRHPLWSALAGPAGALAVCAIALHSTRLHLSGAIPWKGRIYGARASRGARS